MTVINTNTAANITANALTKNERAMSQAMERLSTGQRINSASDDAAGLAISSRMTSQINGLNMAVRNANDAISMVQTEDGSLVEVTNMLQRMRELAVQMANGIYEDTPDRNNAQLEVTALINQITLIAENTRFNDVAVIDGSFTSVNIQAGNTTAETIELSFVDMASSGLVIDGVDVGTQSNATSAIGTLDSALETISTEQATFGSLINRLDYSIANQSRASVMTEQALGRIMDSDFATESTALSKSQILNQAATSMLAQANQSKSLLLQLIQ